MKNIFFLTCLTLILFTSCKSKNLYKIEGRQIAVTDSLKSNQSIEDYIKPYRIQINKSLDSVISYAKDTYSKRDGHLNTAIGNMMADAVYEESNPVFKSRTGKEIDFVLLNHGGIRSIISKGNISTRTAYSVMPFENSVVVVKMKGTKVQELVDYLVREQRAHPIHRLQIILDEELQLKSATINGETINTRKTYYVATNDYLYNGGDRMTFFKPNDSLHVLDYKIRNVLIDYFTKNDTIAPVIDDRFIQIKQ
ncbi:5'-nucleotidase C-terminal domain-containing protein [Psychroserpens jangbogonensis]|uniref:5'-nucleotidase C-terminal domain-containing protein n=1 Tax=Psychroserpens jangbogonensis TaxID=1484460 RepID=UPI00053DA033|nr:5'-nucleotidase [Psychroserpens jangbogonensis]